MPQLQAAHTAALAVLVTIGAGVLGNHLLAQSEIGDVAVMPQYDSDSALRLPPNYRRWTLVGTSLGLSYNEDVPKRVGFNHTLMEPTAYDHFVETGEFREGTMLALLVRGADADAMPARHGQFASEVFAVELAVKDSSRVEEGWAYYDFRGGDRARTLAQPFPKSRGCYTCHVDHAARDNVFLQFYPLLADAAGLVVD